MNKTPGPEIICIGELLIDLISTEYSEDFSSADHYRRLPGGSPANLAMNLARLGRSVALVATVGEDETGALLIAAAQEAGVQTAAVRRVAEPTTLILVTKSRAVSNFEPYRMADRHIVAEQFSQLSHERVRVMHTTAFALSREPERSVILAAMAAGADAGARLSVDFNYADKIWGGDREAGQTALRRIAGLNGLIKVSEVDFERLFGYPVEDPEKAAEVIMKLGAAVVCLTLGEEGCYVISADDRFHLPARPVEVADTTGAGDAFWSGFLAAYVEDRSLKECALAGRAMAELKLVRVGPVQDQLRVSDLLEG